MKKLLFMLCLTASTISEAQFTNNITWQAAIGCQYSESPANIIRDADGSYLVTGHFYETCTLTGTDYGSMDGWVIKVDSNGTKIWSASIGGSEFDYLYKGLKCTDGGYLVVGETSSDIDTHINNGSRDYLIAKLDNDGNIEWQKVYGGTLGDVTADVIEIPGGDFLIAGASYSSDGDITNSYGDRDAWIIKVNAQGELIWSKNFGSSAADAANCIIRNNAGNYIITGLAGAADNDLSGMAAGHLYDMWLFEIDTAGNLLWSKTYGGPEWQHGNRVIQTQDGGYLIGGSADAVDIDVATAHGMSDFWAVKTDAAGTLQWERSFGGSSLESLYDIHESMEGGYMLLGISGSDDVDISEPRGAADVFCVKVAANGTLQWSRVYGGTGGDVGLSIVDQLSDSTYILGSLTNSGDIDVQGHSGSHDAWLIRISKEHETPVSVPHTSAGNNIEVYPTVTTGIININLPGNVASITTTITDITGRKVAHSCLKKNNISYSVALTEFASGVYFLQINSGNLNSVFKIIRQ